MICSKCKIDKSPDAFQWQNRLAGKRHPRCRLCRSADSREYQKHNTEAIRQRRALSQTPERRLAASARSGRWYQENRERALANVKARRSYLMRNDPEWVDAERRRSLVKAHRRRAMAVSAGVEPYDREEIFSRDGWRCHICGGIVRDDPSIDHLVPISKGGSDAPINVRLAHLSCNISRGAGRIPAQLLLIA